MWQSSFEANLNGDRSLSPIIIKSRQLSDRKNLCKNLIDKGPEIIISYYDDFTYKCLISSKEYIIDNNKKDLEKRNLYIFRSNKSN